MKAKFIGGILLPLAFYACKKDNTQQALPPTAIPVITVEQRTVESFTAFPVSIEGKVNNQVRAKISGYITKVYVDEGQMVSKGQPLFQLETNVLAQNANAARSGVNAAQASISAAEASVTSAQVEVNKLIPLVEKKIISNVQLESAKANLLQAQGQLEQAKAAYQQSKSNLSGIQANIDFGVVRSPISGVLGAINFREGSLVGPSDQTPITTVSEIGEVYAYFSMNEAAYFNFMEDTPGETISQKLSNLPDVDLILANGKPYPEKGKIKTVTGQINPATGTIQFRATFSNRDRLLSNGNSGTIHIPKVYPDALIVPESATFEQQGLTFVYKIEKDTARTANVVISDRSHNLAIIASGLKAGDKVAAQGTGKIRPGAAVKSLPVSVDSIANAVKPIF